MREGAAKLRTLHGTASSARVALACFSAAFSRGVTPITAVAGGAASEGEHPEERNPEGPSFAKDMAGDQVRMIHAYVLDQAKHASAASTLAAGGH